MFYKLFLFFLLVEGYKYVPVSKFKRNFKNNLESINVFEQINVYKKNTTCVIFLTGGSSIVPPFIYGDFLNNIVYNDFSIYVPKFNYPNKDILINTLSNEYKDVIIAGHSSGGTTAIKYAKHNLIKKIILIDPVDTRIFSKKYRNKIHNLENLDNILFLNAAKSFKITYDPPALAFIPFLQLKSDILKVKDTCIITKIEAEDFGHCDILDLPYSNVMHNTRVSVGYNNRTNENIRKYHEWLTSIFIYFSNEELKKLNTLDYISYKLNLNIK
tara:strand:- start:1004 stop:1816 length:813 start_codon:yes stop_codon:yes gene_type:complete